MRWLGSANISLDVWVGVAVGKRRESQLFEGCDQMQNVSIFGSSGHRKIFICPMGVALEDCDQTQNDSVFGSSGHRKTVICPMGVGFRNWPCELLTLTS